MSRDYTSAEWIDTVLYPRRRNLEELERHLQYIRETAHAEGRAQALKEAVEEIETMPKNDNAAQKLATRRVSNILHIPMKDAVPLVEAKKTSKINWGQAADAVLEEQAGDGFPEAAE